jgi:diacylglycerol O-acyltransferase / wax synthase
MSDVGAPDQAGAREGGTGPVDGPDIRFEHRMSDADALMWSIEKDPMLRSTITTLVVLDGELEPERVWHTFERASRVVPRLRQRVRSNPLSLAPPRWEIDPNFDLRYHVRFARVPGGGTMQDLLRMASPLAMQGFDRARPQWECTVVDGLDGGRSALILKIHHAVTDGVGGVRLMLEVFDLDHDAAQRSLPDPPPVHVMGQAERFADAFAHQTRRQLGIAKRMVTDGAGNATGLLADPPAACRSTADLATSVARVLRPVSQPLSPLMTGRSLSNHFETVTLPLDLAKRAGKRIGGTLNDTFVTGLARGLQRYHADHGVRIDALRMGMPINVREAGQPETAGNAFVPARFEIPVHAEDPVELMRSIRARMVAARDEPANQLVELLSNVLNRLPTTVVTQIFGTMMKGLDFQASNVPGAPVPLYLHGVQVSSIVPFGPLAGAASNVTLLSYRNDLNIGVNVDPAAVPDPERYIACLRAGYDEVLDLA